MRSFQRGLATAALLLLLFPPCLLKSQSDDLVQQSHRARELMGESRFEEAIPIYEHLVKALPDNPGFLLNLGLAQEMAGHPSAAIPCFQSFLKLQPDNIPALTSLAMAELQTGQPRLAITSLERLTRLKPDDVNAYGMLAVAEMNVGRFETAAGQYRKLTEISPYDAKAWYGLGKAYSELATQAFEKLNKAAPQSAYMADLLADSRLQRGQFRSAFFFYHAAETQMPSLPGVHAGLAKVYENTGHSDWALAEKRKEQTISDPNCTTQTSECRFLKGDFLGAAKAGTASLKSAGLFWSIKAYNELASRAFDQLGKLPESVEIHALKAQILHDHRQDTEAVNEWRAALALAPGDPELEADLASALFTAHKYDQVMPLLQKLLARQPASADLNFMMGESLWRTEQPDKAVPYLTTALHSNPNLLPAHAALGMVYAMLNRNADAVPHLEKAVSLDDDGSLHYSLARAYQAAGNTVQAREAMQEYQQIRQKNQEVNEQLAKESEITAP